MVNKEKYSISTVKKYLNAEDLCYDANELEDDPKFMLLVIKRSHDKNLYNLCSDNVKKNYLFVRTIVDLFKKDFDFIYEVVMFYCEDKEFDDVTSIELKILLSSLLPSVDEIFDRNLYGAAIELRSDIEAFLGLQDLIKNTEYEGNKTIKNQGLTFKYYLNVYGGSKIIMDFLADNELKNIFYNGDNVESNLYQIIGNVKVKEIGVRNFILNYVETFDPYLSDYLKTNISLLKDLENRIEKLLIRKKEHDRIVLNNKFEIIDELIRRKEYDRGIIYSSFSYIYHVAKKFNLGEQYLKYILPYLPSGTKLKELDEASFSFCEKKIVLFINKTLKDLLSSPEIDEEKYDSYIDAESSNKGPGIKIKFSIKDD